MKKLFLFLTLFIFSVLQLKTIAQSVGIGTATPNASAQLDVTSTTKGMLIPRMTQAERDALTTVQGLLIFNITSNSFQYHNGSAWTNLTHSGIVSGLPNRIPRFVGLWGLTSGMMTDNGTGVSLNNTAAVPDASAIMDIQSTTKGLLIPRMTTGERTAIPSPFKGLLVFDNTTSSFWFYNGSVWTEINAGSGSSEWSVNGTNIYNSNSGNVGIGTATPSYKLDVVGNSRFTGWVAINDPNPDYPLDVNGLASIQYLGVGGAIPNTTYPLDVLSNARFQSSLNVNGSTTVLGNSLVDGNMTVNSNGIVDGTLTVNNGKGVAYNSTSATNLKIYPFTTATFGAVLPGFGLSAEGAIAFNGGFTGVPRVFVGDIDVTGGSAGELYRVQLQLYGCTTTSGTTSCKARLLNTSPNPVNYTITWNCVAIGN
jgi:hypothetical protein